MKKLFVATFETEEAVLGATRAAREAGIPIHDVYTPYAVHGLDEAMGLRPTRLGFVCFGMGLFGAAAAWALQWWMSAASWPLNVGGRPFHSLPAYVPVIFELMVLCAALGTVAALFLRAGLLPGRRAAPLFPRTTDDRFALALATPERPGSEEVARGICKRFSGAAVGLVEVRA